MICLFHVYLREGTNLMQQQQQFGRLMELNTCSLCSMQCQKQLTEPYDIPIYQPANDTVRLANRTACKQCCSILSSIHYFAMESQIRFCNHNFKSHLFSNYSVDQALQPKKAIQLYYASGAQALQKRASFSQSRPLQSKRLSLTERSLSEEVPSDDLVHPYVPLLIEQILQKNYLTLLNFPKTLQYLIYLSSLPNKNSKSPQVYVLAEERHEKIKNILLILAQKIHLNIEQLPYLLFLINFLLAIMDAPKVISIIVQLCNIQLAYSHLISWKTLIFQHERSNSQSPQSPATFDMRSNLIQIDKLWSRLELIIDLARKGQAVFREGLIRLSKIQMIGDYKEFKKKCHEALKSLTNKKQDLQSLNENQLNTLYMMKLQRNSFTLILREIMEEEQGYKNHISHIQHKNKLQKDQYIDKIVRLNNKIQQLQKKIVELEQTNKKLSHRVARSSFAKSQFSSSPTQQQFQQQMFQGQQLDFHIQLQSILTVSDIVAFNEKHYHHHIKKHEQEDTSNMNITQRIIHQIQKIQEVVQKISGKNKSIEDEKTKLLGIITRKQQRYLSVILEKDTVIQRYQQALWTMENGLEVTQGPLANRIKYIMHIFANKSKASQQLFMQQVNRQQVTKKVKQKDCEIY